MRAKDALGRYGEQVAARALVAAGLQVLDRNWRCPIGELDIVAREQGVLVVCEVKTRRSTAYGAPWEAVDERKLARLHRLAFRWLAEHDAHPVRVRVDVVGVLVPREGGLTVQHVRGVA